MAKMFSILRIMAVANKALTLERDLHIYGRELQ